MMSRFVFTLPGKSLFSPPKPPEMPPPAPIPTRDDPSVTAARDKLRLSEKRRAGRTASVLTGPEGTLGEPTVSRAGATVLGGTGG